MSAPAPSSSAAVRERLLDGPPPTIETGIKQKEKSMTKNEQLARDGYEALMRGEVEVVENLMAPGLTWHWWEHGPWDCHSRDEAMAVIRERLDQRAVGELIEVTEVEPDQVLIVSRARPDSEVRPEDLGLAPDHLETANVITFRDGKVIAMHDYRTKAEALEATKGGGHAGS
jgi:ketosteroid isomerase-like protein